MLRRPIALWIDELRRLRNELREAPTQRNPASISTRMSRHEYAIATAAQNATQIVVDRLNVSYADFADLLLEHREVALAAGVSLETLAETKAMLRWTYAVKDLSGEDPNVLVGSDWSWPKRLTCSAIGKLISVAMAIESASGNNQTRAATPPEGASRVERQWSEPDKALLTFLKGQPDCMCAVSDLSTEYLNPDLLNVMDADGLIEFGRRNHCHVGGRLVVERGWDFKMMAGPDTKPIRQIIDDALVTSIDPQIRLHVRLTNSRAA